MIKLNENIKKYRQQKNMTQSQLADVFNVSEQAISRWETSSFRLIELLAGEELKIHCKNTVMQFVLATYSTMVKLADLDFANDNMTIRERIDVIKKILELLDLIYEGNFGYESRLVAWMHRAIAAMEVLEGNTEATLEHLEQTAKYSIIYDTLPDRFTLDSTLLSGIECKDHYRNFDWTECTEFNEKLRQGRYDIVRNTDRFKAVEKEITPYVVTKN